MLWRHGLGLSPQYHVTQAERGFFVKWSAYELQKHVFRNQSMLIWSLQGRKFVVIICLKVYSRTSFETTHIFYDRPNMMRRNHPKLNIHVTKVTRRSTCSSVSAPVEVRTSSRLHVTSWVERKLRRPHNQWTVRTVNCSSQNWETQMLKPG
jgi:hypothetical protein